MLFLTLLHCFLVLIYLYLVNRCSAWDSQDSFSSIFAIFSPRSTTSSIIPMNSPPPKMRQIINRLMRFQNNIPSFSPTSTIGLTLPYPFIRIVRYTSISSNPTNQGQLNLVCKIFRLKLGQIPIIHINRLIYTKHPPQVPHSSTYHYQLCILLLSKPQYQQWLSDNIIIDQMLARRFTTLLSNKKLITHPHLISKSITYAPKIFGFAIENKSEQRFQQIRMHTTLSEYPGLNPQEKQHTKNQVRLENDPETGLRFMIQTSGFTGCSDMGICVKLGTQDQDQKNAGSLQYLKSFVHMKPTFEELVGNYQVLHQTGSTFDLNYDAMTTYAKCSFLQQDQDLMINLLLDLALQEKNMFEDNHVTEVDLSNITELVRRTAFGGKALGMPSKGIGNTLTNQEFLKFQQKITPKNMIISMSNISDPQAFIQKIKHNIKTKYPKFLQRKPQPTPKSAYVGGLKQFESNGQLFQFAVAFPSAQSKSPQMELFNILRVLLGTASSFSSGGPGKGMHSRCTKYLLNQVRCVQKASYINEHYDDFGLFGLTVGGPHQEYMDVIQCTLIELGQLTQLIPEEQLDRAKHILISSIYQNIERQPDRLEELTKHIFYYDKVKLYEFEHNIRKVTAKQIQDVIKNLFNQKPTFVYSGNEQSLKSLPSEKNLGLSLKQAIQIASKGRQYTLQ